jgi:steroid 5-alpha reductase family enzyme
MHTEELSLRSQIALGWIAILLVGSMVFNFAIIQSLLTEVDKRFRTLRFDPGIEGMKILVFPVAFYALMPVYVFLVNDGRSRVRVFRWLAVSFAAVGFVFNLLHHLQHWYFGQKPDFSAHVPDLAIHVLGLWVLVNSVRWARLPPAAA